MLQVELFRLLQNLFTNLLSKSLLNGHLLLEGIVKRTIAYQEFSQSAAMYCRDQRSALKSKMSETY